MSLHLVEPDEAPKPAEDDPWSEPAARTDVVFHDIEYALRKLLKDHCRTEALSLQETALEPCPLDLWPEGVARRLTEDQAVELTVDAAMSAIHAAIYPQRRERMGAVE